MPFVTEEIYQRLPGNEGSSIMISPFPVLDESEIDEESEKMMETIMGVIDVIRNIRGETGIAPNVRMKPSSGQTAMKHFSNHTNII